METAMIIISFGVWSFLLFGLKDCVQFVANSATKKAEAKARAEEARTERARIEFDHAKFERSNNSLM